ncbi:thiamine phosphate synthase [Novosphingobium sp. 9]|uniref:thiamine phosphate synthase n=1 Tax=Novosphingobium sp. 9 TaxID=2025349 RepID=UPI0021B69B32|nr:thiamine phosphate synthase [Novosphingobium sp. 9]
MWLISDARNDARLERVLARLPRGSGFVFRHYHLSPAERLARWRELQRTARRFGHCAVFAGTMAEARRYRADGAYGPPKRLARGDAGLRLITAHSLRELAQARRACADAVLLSPVFATNSHPGAPSLGPVRFRLLAARAGLPVIALGGMTKHRAATLAPHAWAAIDGHL